MANEKSAGVLKIEEQEKQLKARKRKLIAREKQKEKKELTTRQVEIGKVVEEVLGKPIPKEDLPKLKTFLEQQEQRGKYFSKAMAEKVEQTV